MSEANSTPEPTPTGAPPAKNYIWIYYFAFLIIASVGVAVFMIQFNRGLQLKPEELEANHKFWDEKGPKSYDMVYSKQISVDGPKTIFTVKVRAGKVEEVLMNGKPLEAGTDNDPRSYHSMNGIFRDIERFMDIDQKRDAPKVYVTANFDPETGCVQRYIRYVMGTAQRVELNVKLEAVK
jgi:Family of unknown function (DUF6174)